MDGSNSMILMSRASEMLAKATTVQAAKELRDLALTAADWARRKCLGEEAVQYAKSYAFEAERRMGELLRNTERAKGGQPYRTNPTSTGSVEVEPTAPTIPKLGLTHNESSRAQFLADLPTKIFKAVCEGKITLAKAKREHKRKQRQAAVARAAAKVPDLADRYELHHSACLTALELPKDSVDLIVTDPPYGEEFLGVYEDLGKVAAALLKPGGLALVMIGQTYLPQVIEVLGRYLQYRWSIAYLTPGGQSAQQFQVKVNTFWKPVLVYAKGEYAGDWFGDVARSDANDNDKRHHEWGQSISGMRDLMRRFVRPGDTVLDPFLGGGTTAVVALELQANFIGFDHKRAAIDTTKARIRECRT